MIWRIAKNHPRLQPLAHGSPERARKEEPPSPAAQGVSPPQGLPDWVVRSLEKVVRDRNYPKDQKRGASTGPPKTPDPPAPAQNRHYLAVGALSPANSPAPNLPRQVHRSRPRCRWLRRG